MRKQTSAIKKLPTYFETFTTDLEVERQFEGHSTNQSLQDTRLQLLWRDAPLRELSFNTHQLLIETHLKYTFSLLSR